MTFSEALDACKDGKRIARLGWNGKGMFVFISYQLDGMPYNLPALPFLAMKTADEKICVGWLASQTDILANDWAVLP